jgi:heme A synthase
VCNIRYLWIFSSLILIGLLSRIFPLEFAQRLVARTVVVVVVVLVVAAAVLLKNPNKPNSIPL